MTGPPRRHVTRWVAGGVLVVLVVVGIVLATRTPQEATAVLEGPATEKNLDSVLEAARERSGTAHA